MYPTKIEANGRIYEINTDYRVALACLEAINDEEITDLERYFAIEGLLLGFDINNDDREILKEKMANYLRCGETQNISDSEVDFDYFEDLKYIRPSMRQTYYGLDLNKIDYLHWWEYNELISGLLPDSILNRVRDLRNYNINEIKDQKERERIRKAKQQVALKNHKKKATKEQKESAKKFFDMMKGVDINE